MPMVELLQQAVQLAQDHGAEHFVPNVEVVVRIARPVPFEDAVVRIVGRILGHHGTESGALFHTFEDEVHPEPLATFHAEAVGPDQVFVLDALLGNCTEPNYKLGPESRHSQISNFNNFPDILIRERRPTSDLARKDAPARSRVRTLCSL